MKFIFDATIDTLGVRACTCFSLISVGTSIALCFLIAVGVVGSAQAQSDEVGAEVDSVLEAGSDSLDQDFDPDLDTWVFSAAFEAGLMAYKPKASMSGSPFDPGAPISPRFEENNDGPRSVIASRADRGRMISALLGVDLEVMAPRMGNSRWIPRPFLDLNVSAVLGSERSIVRRGKPEPDSFALPDRVGGTLNVGGTRILGQGEEVTAQQQGPAVFVGFGAAFTFDLDSGSRLRVKPSLVYSRTPVDVSGIASRVVKVDTNTAAGLDAFRFIVVGDAFLEVYHGIGPAIELELDTNNRLGPFELSLYLKGHANHNFGDLETDFQQSNPDFPLETVRWRYEHERWTYRASTGIRFRLVGKK